jgi:hypothetical protein
MQLIIFFILLLTSCVPKPSNIEPHPAKDMVLEIERKVLLQLKKEKNLYPCEFGSGGKTPVTLLHWGFNYYRKVGIEEARELILSTTDHFLAEINSNEKIRPYLASYPFQPENLQIVICFFNQDGSLLEPEKLSIVSIHRGKLKYDNLIPSAGLPLTTIYQETYEEASAKLEQKTIQLSGKDELSRDEIFPPKDGKLRALQGRINNGRYYSPKNIFSCQAYDFGEEKHLSQDVHNEISETSSYSAVGFYHKKGDFKKAEIIFAPVFEKKVLGEKDLKEAFNHFGIGILESVDHAQNIEILEEEIINDHVLFVAISIEKMAVLKGPNNECMPSTRGYLIFQEKDKLILLSNQKVIFSGEQHLPKLSIEQLKKDILEYKKTFEFGK